MFVTWQLSTYKGTGPRPGSRLKTPLKVCFDKLLGEGAKHKTSIKVNITPMTRSVSWSSVFAQSVSQLYSLEVGIHQIIDTLSECVSNAINGCPSHLVSHVVYDLSLKVKDNISNCCQLYAVCRLSACCVKDNVSLVLTRIFS